MSAWFRCGNSLATLPSEQDLENEREANTIIHEYKHLSPSELLEAFPEALPIIKKTLRGFNEDYKKYNDILKEFLYETILPIIYASNESDAQKKERSAKAINFFYQQPMQKVERQIKKLDTLLKVSEWKRAPMKDEITDADIARAKEFPLSALMQVNYHGFARCPFHNEKTASFKIYRDNRFHCFGCGENGDVIDYVMKKEEIGFIDAVKRLLNR